MKQKLSNYQNFILRSLSKSDLALLEPAMERVALEVRFPIEMPHVPIEHVYFIEDGIASTVGTLNDEREIEVGITGREGMTGTAVVLGAGQTPYSTYIQSPGSGFRIASEDLRAAMKKSPTLRLALYKIVQAFMVQIGSTALANGHAKLEIRLARWLLMLHDRETGTILTLTHEFLAVMLGVQRPNVTVAVQVLEGKGLIRASRGQISVFNRSGLVDFASGFYGSAELEYARLTGDPLSR
jgi:CRP-like cAMP-binding protein